MFLNRFNEDEKIGFIELALLGVRADDAITTEEVQFVEELRLSMGVAEEAFVQQILGDPQLDDAVRRFATDESRRLAFIELVALAYVDGQYDPAESQFLRQVQQAFGIDQTTVLACHAWARRLLQLRQDALALAQGRSVTAP
ncbi:MAG: TerB family tellurite resistance protein [Candidatus Sericytochromatia bacterium]|nr:TerB family tellurite resistance protein [Candidatus Sericytochromatia bacterium]